MGPIGPILVAATDRGLCRLYVLDGDDPSPALARLRRDVPGAVFEEDEAFGREVASRVTAHVVDGDPVDDIALDLRGTPFQLRVWDALRAIPRGETTSYGALGRAIGLPPGASRAVGAACGSNPVSLIVPCHRVLRTGGGLGGYYWGLDRKRALLEMEGADLDHAAGSETVLTAVP
jgi:O-6-methylguanine DNA methyltransferase